MRTDDQYKKYKELKRSGKIPKQSKKRKKENIRYLDQIKMFREESREKANFYCFFCGEEENKNVHGKWLCIHHLRGRTGDYYLDSQWWVWGHNDCHLDFHHKPIEWLMKQSWFSDFSARLSTKDDISFLALKKRIDKSHEEIAF